MIPPKPAPLPADPRDALRMLFSLSEECKHTAEDAHRRVERAIDDARDAADRARALFNLIDRWSVDHDPGRMDSD